MPWKSVSSIIYTNKKRAGQQNYPPLTNQSLDNLVHDFIIHNGICTNNVKAAEVTPAFSRDSWWHVLCYKQVTQRKAFFKGHRKACINYRMTICASLITEQSLDLNDLKLAEKQNFTGLQQS
jgi:hypothetical protein